MARAALCIPLPQRIVVKMTQPASDPRPASVLTIAGSDSGGGAGIQADLLTFADHGVHGLSAITAITAQNTRAVTAVQVLPTALIEAQVDAVFADFRIAAVKLGMLADAGVIHCVAALLARHRPPAVVLDPVMVASSGARLLDPAALDALRDALLPLATLVTPNVPEAELLLGRPITAVEDLAAAAAGLRRLGAVAVLLKGGHLPGDPVTDLLDAGGELQRFVHPRLPVEGHGTGCTLASAVAARLARGEALGQACAGACDYVHQALQQGFSPGLGPVRVLARTATPSHARPGPGW